MRFDAPSIAPRRINGVRNFRQALASPYPVLVHDPARRFSEVMPMAAFRKLTLVLALASVLSACALHNPNISDLQRNPGRYQDRSVNIRGVVTNSWGLPLVPFRFYRVDDGTGEVTVLSQGVGRTPTKGARVHVKGRVNEVGVFGGQALGLHLREQDLDIKGR
jgi:hypothetical protein